MQDKAIKFLEEIKDLNLPQAAEKDAFKAKLAQEIAHWKPTEKLAFAKAVLAIYAEKSASDPDSREELIRAGDNINALMMILSDYPMFILKAIPAAQQRIREDLQATADPVTHTALNKQPKIEPFETDDDYVFVDDAPSPANTQNNHSSSTRSVQACSRWNTMFTNLSSTCKANYMATFGDTTTLAQGNADTQTFQL